MDSGVKQAQVFVGRDTLVADAYPMKSGKQFVNTLEDNIRRRGSMDKLLSDSAKTEISQKVMDILRAYHISYISRSDYMFLILNGILHVTEITKIGSSQYTNNS